MKNYDLEEAAKLLNKSAPHLRKLINKGTIPALKVPKGKREVWVISHETLELLRSDVRSGDYEKLYQQWIDDQRSGYHTGKPLGEAGIEGNSYGIRVYWECSGIKKSVVDISPENLKRALSAPRFAVDYEKRKDHYAIKLKVYNAVRSFYKLLQREGFKSHADDGLLSRCRPKAVFPPRRIVVKNDGFIELLTQNEVMTSGRRKDGFDNALSKTLLYILGYAGLRFAEVVNLQVEHLDLDEGILEVIDGKGHKDRQVGIRPDLEKQLRIWLQRYRPKNGAPNVLLQTNGKPITENVVRGRLRRLSANAKVDCHPHAFRRFFATHHADLGIPVPHIQKMLGHVNIETTMLYLRTDIKDAIASFRNIAPSNQTQKNTLPKLKPL